MKDDFFVIDVETTGLDAAKSEICEYAVVEVLGDRINTVICDLVKPSIPIPPETSAVHQIIDEDVAGHPGWTYQSDVVRSWVLAQSRQNEPVLVAHNAEYEKVFFEPLFPNIPWICTYKCALRAWPDAPSHSNEGLRHWLKLSDRGRSTQQAPHSAGHDAVVTAKILIELLKLHSADTLILWTIEPAQLPTCPIGKHRGQKWDNMPFDYLQWLVRAPDMRKDVKDCAQLEIERRRGPQ